MKTTFRESLRFDQWWLWLLMITVELVVLVSMIGNFLFTEKGKEGSYPDLIVSAVIFIVVTVITILLRLTRLETEADATSFRFRWTPFMKDFSVVPWTEISQAYIAPYGHIGYGLRFSPRYGTIHIPSGKEGLQIVRTNGAKLFFGTKKAAELEEFLRATGKKGDQEQARPA